MCQECGCTEHEVSNRSIHQETEGDKSSHAHHKHTISLGVSVLQKNDEYAAENRSMFSKRGLYVINLISSPGSGKTMLLEALARRFGEKMIVIEGDIQTRRDSERVIRAGSRAVQIETGGACHLDAHTIGHVLEKMDCTDASLLLIENVGNLVCPASYDLGENEKWAILSVPEGDDKILKYPAIFSRIQALVINKTDLLDRIDFNIDNAINECKSLNRGFITFAVSAKAGTGMDALFSYLCQKAGIA